MIVKFARRGKGGGAGPVEYLLGKERDRDGATLNHGNPDQVQALIDSSPYAKKYTTGYLCFAEQNLSTEIKERLMSEFEEVLLPGMDKDQYSCLWVEHLDKGRLELNFVVPNIELLTGKRLQPYFHKADNPRLDAWRTIKNIELRLKDPDNPSNRQALIKASNLPTEVKEVGNLITDGLLQMANAGQIKSRQDVIATLESQGFEIARVTKKSISIKHPEEGRRNIRLKGLLYEQDFRYGEGLQRAIEEASDRHRAAAQKRLQDAQVKYSSCFERKRAANHQRYKRPEPAPKSTSTQNMGLVSGNSDLGDHRQLGRDLVGRGDDRQQGSGNYQVRREYSGTGKERGENSAVDLWRKDLYTSIQGRQGELDSNVGRSKTIYSRGVLSDDGVRTAVIEHLRGLTDSIRESAKQFIGNVQGYLSKQRDLTRASQRFERESECFNTAIEQYQQSNLQLERSAPELREFREGMMALKAKEMRSETRDMGRDFSR